MHLIIFWTYPWEGVERAVVRGLFVVEGWFLQSIAYYKYFREVELSG